MAGVRRLQSDQMTRTLVYTISMEVMQTMMISPEVYYKEFLQGKDQESILEQICLLREKTSWLKQLLEYDDHGEKEATIMPSSMTRIKCNREYLEMAKRALEEAGGHYESTEEELRDQSFNMNLTHMHEFTLEIGGFFSGYTKYMYTISGNKVIVDAEHSYIYKPTAPPVFESFTREEYLQSIASFHMGEWKQRYDNPYVLDGTQWSIDIQYDSNMDPVEFYGSNAFPYNFQELLDFLTIK